MTAGSWPAVDVRMIPGRSTTVRSGTSGEDRRTLMVSVEKLLEVDVSPSVNRSSSCFSFHQTVEDMFEFFLFNVALEHLSTPAKTIGEHFFSQSLRVIRTAQQQQYVG